MKRIRSPSTWLLVLIGLLAMASWWHQHTTDTPATAGSGIGEVTARGTVAGDDWPAFLPPEARPVLRRIATGGPHPYRQDGSVFGNRERRLPGQPHGYYREYTVDTPGLDHRGARRIVTGGKPPSVYYYTDDHYGSFRRFEPSGNLLP